MQNAEDQTKMTTTADSFDEFDSILPIISWADFIGDTEYDRSSVVVPSWANMDLAVMDAEVPEPSARVQRRVENPESSVRRVYGQKSDCRVWRKPAPSPSDFRVRSSQASEARNQFRRNNNGFPQEERMGGAKCSSKPHISTTPPSQDWRRLPPQDFIRITARPVRDASPPQHQGPATSSSENGVGPLQITTPAKTVAQKQELGGQKLAIKPPVTPTPAPEPEYKSLPSRWFKKSLTEAAPRRPKAYPPGFFKRLEPTDASPPQNMSLPSDFNQKLRAALKNTPLLQAKPCPPGFFKRLEPIDDSPPQHQNLSSSSPTVIGVSPQEGQKNIMAKTFPQRQGMRSSLRTECSLEDLCKMLDGLHLSEKPTLSLTPDSPSSLLHPASFIYKTQPKFGSSQHQKSGQEIWKNPPAPPPTPSYTSENLPAPHLNPQPSFLNDKNLYLIRKRPRLSYDS